MVDPVWLEPSQRTGNYFYGRSQPTPKSFSTKTPGSPREAGAVRIL